MAKKKSPVEEAKAKIVLDDEGEKPKDYDEDVFRAEGERIAEAQGKSFAFENVPGGVAAEPDGGRTERAEEIRNDPLRGMSRIERAQYEMQAKNLQIGMEGVHDLQRRGNALDADDRAELERLRAQVAEAEAPGGFVDFTADRMVSGAQPVEQNVKMILVEFYGGAYKVWHFENLGTVQGFAQSRKGTKRLFKYVPGKFELQEINGLGMPINR